MVHQEISSCHLMNVLFNFNFIVADIKTLMISVCQRKIAFRCRHGVSADRVKVRDVRFQSAFSDGKLLLRVW